MAWKPLTEPDLASTLNQRELDAYRKAESDEGVDPIRSILDNTVALVRGYVLSAGSVRLPANDALVPASLAGAALDYAAFDVCKRFKVNVTEDRRKARTDAAALFELVRTGKYAVESPDGDNDSAGPATTPGTIPPCPPRLLD